VNDISTQTTSEGRFYFISMDRLKQFAKSPEEQRQLDDVLRCLEAADQLKAASIIELFLKPAKRSTHERVRSDQHAVGLHRQQYFWSESSESESTFKVRGFPTALPACGHIVAFDVGLQCSLMTSQQHNSRQPHQ
jgi:hypothetical protein